MTAFMTERDPGITLGLLTPELIALRNDSFQDRALAFIYGYIPYMQNYSKCYKLNNWQVYFSYELVCAHKQVRLKYSL